MCARSDARSASVGARANRAYQASPPSTAAVCFLSAGSRAVASLSMPATTMRCVASASAYFRSPNNCPACRCRLPISSAVCAGAAAMPTNSHAASAFANLSARITLPPMILCPNLNTDLLPAQPARACSVKRAQPQRTHEPMRGAPYCPPHPIGCGRELLTGSTPRSISCTAPASMPTRFR